MKPEPEDLAVRLIGADWMSDRTARALAILGVMVMLAVVIASLITFEQVSTPERRVIMDFMAFWAASAMTLDGVPAMAYDWDAHKLVQESALAGRFDGFMPWHYPPSFQLVVAPLASLPTVPAQAVWCAFTLALYLAVVWRIMPSPTALLYALLPGPVAILLLNGQTGFLTAALTGIALLAWQRNPAGAGAAIGLLSIKPQVALAFPVALIAGRQWTAFAVAGAVTVGLAGVSLAVLGVETWESFFGSISRTSAAFQLHDNKWFIYASTYGLFRTAGAGFTAAMIAQGIVSAAVAILLWRAMRDETVAPDTKAALIAYACIAITPRSLDYDILPLFMGALFQVRHARAAGFFPGEVLILAAAVMATLVDFALQAALNALIAPVLFGALVLGARHRDPVTRREAGSVPAPASASAMDRAVKAGAD